MSVLDQSLVSVISIVGLLLGSPRWLRVAQREHYVAGMTTKFALRWWTLIDKPANPVSFVLAVVASELTIRHELNLYDLLGLAALTALVAVYFPLGLSLKGRTSKLEWTKRLKRIAVLSYLLVLALTAIGLTLHIGPLFAGLLAMGYPMIVDLAVAILKPYEEVAARRFVAMAAKKLASLGPRVVAVTGSFGKTTTKGYIASLCSSTMVTVASPASFNNRAGLSRAINENLTTGTELFVAEMGAYRVGEIESLVGWIRPEISVITALGPVHLERFGSEDQILKAKSEIVKGAKVVVLCVDYPKLELLANELEAAGVRVWRCSAGDFRAEVCVKSDEEGGLVVYYSQRRIGYLPRQELSSGNIACATAVALELGISEETIARQLFELKPPPHRLTTTVVENSGIFVLDDTYNSNPTGAKHALSVLAEKESAINRVVVTPGMVELGYKQYSENYKLGQNIAEVATHLVIVGKTNKRALQSGAFDRSKTEGAKLKKVIDVSTREDAVRWVRENLHSGDAVLYENDLPDHFA